MKLFFEWIKENRNMMGAALLCGFVFTLFYGLLGTKAYSDTITKDIASEVIRLHIRANSNSETDQQLKLLVKDAILDRYEEQLNGSTSLAETRGFLEDNLSNIEKQAEELMKEKGYSYTATAAITHEFFPTKTYGTMALPAGEYEALRVDIGEAQGNNWWCVMFPPLCFVDITQKDSEEDTEKVKEQLKEVLTDEEYDLVAKSQTGEDIRVELKFKIVEIWQKVKMDFAARKTKEEYAVIQEETF